MNAKGMTCPAGVDARVGIGVSCFKGATSGSVTGVTGGEFSKMRDEESEIVRSRLGGTDNKLVVDIDRMVVRDVRCPSELEWVPFSRWDIWNSACGGSDPNS